MANFKITVEHDVGVDRIAESLSKDSDALMLLLIELYLCLTANKSHQDRFLSELRNTSGAERDMIRGLGRQLYVSCFDVRK